LVAHGFEPTWSPNGRRLAFVQYTPDESTEALTTLDLRTGNDRILAEGDISEPRWSPNGAWIAFARSGQDYDLDVVHPDGSGLVRVAHTSVMNGYDWSRDSTRIVAVDASGTGDQYRENLFLFSVGGGSPVRLTNDSQLKYDPDWSSTGSAIAYYTFPQSGESNEVFVVDAVSGAQRRIGDGWVPTWSPNAKRLAFLSERGLVVADDSGREARPPLRHGFGAYDSNPVWAGNRIVLFTREDFDGQSRLISAKAAGGSARRLTPASLAAVDPAWSPDGRLLAFSRAYPYGNRELALMRADGSHVRLLTLNRYGWDSQPSWSPDGRRIAFIRADGLGHAELAVLRLSDRRARSLGVTTFVYAHPAWSPDGRTIALDGLRKTSTSYAGIRLLDLETGKLSEEKGDGVDSRPVWSPDGKHLAFVRRYFGGSAVPNVVMVQALGGEPRIVAHGNPWVGPPEVAWSPDGRRLVLAGMSNYPGPAWEVEVIDLEGSVQAIPWMGDLYPTGVSWQPR